LSPAQHLAVGLGRLALYPPHAVVIDAAAPDRTG